MKQSKTYPNIDMIQTGLKLKMCIDNSGMSVNYLELIWRNCWLRSKMELLQNWYFVRIKVLEIELFFIIENYLKLLHRCNCPWLSPWAFLINTLRQEEGK